MKVRVRIHRTREIQRIRSDLERDGIPRIQMSLVVAAVYLASPAAAYITGSTITIDGGLSLVMAQGA